jgi:transcriptional regulator with XRE-family HTH domain
MRRVRIDPAKLRAAREACGLTQDMLAERSGMARGTIQRIEHGRTALPHPETLFVLAKTLGVAPELLLLRSGELPGAGSAPDVYPQDAPAVARAPERGEPNARRRRGNARLSDAALPAGPPMLLGRGADLEQARARLGEDDTDAPRALVIDGWPGVGKTAFAAELARERAVRAGAACPVLWATLGPAPSLRGVLLAWSARAGVPPPAIVDMPAVEISAHLTHVLRDARALLVVDDAWSVADVQLLRVGGARAGLIVTTRLPAVADALAPQAMRMRLGELGTRPGLELLRAHAPYAVRREREACRSLVQALGGLPLAIEAAGRVLAATPRSGTTVRDMIAALTGDPRAVLMAPLRARASQRIAPGSAPTLEDAFARSANALSEPHRSRLASLGAWLGARERFEAADVEAVCSGTDARATLAELADHGLIEARAPSRYRMHPLVRAHAVTMQGPHTTR